MPLNVNMVDKLKKLKYDNSIPPAQKKKINIVNDTMFGDDVTNIMMPTPPSNESLRTYKELEYLSELPENDVFVKQNDDISSVFENLCKKLDIEFPSDNIKNIIRQSAGVILYYKWIFNRPRPTQLASLYQINIGDYFKLESMETPAYPSGHSTQGYLIAGFLSKLYPEHENTFIKVAEDISYSRQVARAHYPSDSEAGKQLGITLLGMMYEKDQNS